MTSGRLADSASDLAEQIRDALLHLYDLSYLQAHPLAKRLQANRHVDGTSNPGRALRQALLDAVEALHPGQDLPSGSSASRAYQLLHLRYVEGLDVIEVQRRLAIGKSEYHRDLRKAIAALALLLGARFGLGESSEAQSQADGPGEATVPAPVATLPSSREPLGNLPIPLTSFVGRAQEVAEVRGLLAEHRLVTLTGTGGSGKTRLALHVAGELSATYADGVWLVELGALADPALVPQTVAVILGLVEEAGRPIVSTLTDYLRPKRLLVVLDNCEHLVEACARLAEALLRSCPALIVLATSRETLRVDGETVYSVPPLAVPDPESLPALEELLAYDAVQLFAERAACAAPAFEMSPDNSRSVARICSRLDGLPLAIELAAARVRVLTPEQIAQRLDDRFGLLTGGSRAALPRHQTLVATLDWSHDLLSEPEQILFRRLAVFVGGWSLEAAEAVCADDVVKASQVLNLLTKLVDRSLVVPESQDGTMRFRFLETVREYGWGRLIDSGEADELRNRHRDWALAVAESVAYGGRCLTLWPVRIAREHDNFRAAVEWSRSQPDGAEAEQRLATALAHFQRSWGFESEAHARLCRALARSVGLLPATRVPALLWLGIWETFDANPARARELYEESLVLAQEVGDPALLASVLRHLAWHAKDAGRPSEALRLLQEALSLARRSGDPFETAMALEGQGEIFVSQGDHARARLVLDECLAIAVASAESQPLNFCRSDLGALALAEGDYARAHALFEENLVFARSMGSGKSIADSLASLGDVARAEGDYPAAESLYQQFLNAAREAGARVMIGMALGRLADLWAVKGRWREAARLYGALDAWHAAAGMSAPHHPHPDHDRDLAATRSILGVDFWTQVWAEGQAMTIEQAVELALQDEAEAHD